MPVIWFHETTNALLVLERRKKLKTDEYSRTLSALKSFNIKADHEGIPLVFGKVSELADAHNLSVYDAAYLELAMREGLPFATKDSPRQTAARKCGVRLLLK